MATPEIRNLKAQEILLNQTISLANQGKSFVPDPANRIRITKSRAGSHPRRILADSGKIQLPTNLKQATSPEPVNSEKKPVLQYPPPLPDEPVE